MQTYANHRRFFPLFHFIVSPILGINFVVQAVFAIRYPTGLNIWNAVFAFGVFGLAFAARLMALKVQDRLIRLEERLRLMQILPDDLRSRVSELRARHLIALRFADDAEVPELCRGVLNGELQSSDDIKRRIKTWRPDTFRA